MRTLIKKIGTSVDIITAILFIVIIVIILIKLPAHILDILLIVIMSISLIFFMISVFIQKPIDSFSIFPTCILIITLLRIAWNISVFRLILFDVHHGSEGVSHIITISGKMIVGENLMAGFIIFALITFFYFQFIIPFTDLIAKTFGICIYCSEPIKSFLIDADLNRGLIDIMIAKARRRELKREVNFYKAMARAGKFVNVEALLLVIITLTGIAGGVLIGIFRQGMTAGEALHHYTALSVGNGFFLTFCAFLMSTGMGMLVSRAVCAVPLLDCSIESIIFIIKNLTVNPKTLFISGIIMFVLNELVVAKVIYFPLFPILFLAVMSKILQRLLREYHKEIENALKLLRQELF